MGQDGKGGGSFCCRDLGESTAWDDIAKPTTTIKHCLKAKILHNELMHALRFVAKLLSAIN